jgi:hypothetical protein
MMRSTISINAATERARASLPEPALTLTPPAEIEERPRAVPAPGLDLLNRKASGVEPVTILRCGNARRTAWLDRSQEPNTSTTDK